MIKRLVARITGWPLVLCPYALQKDCDGRTHVRISGVVIRHHVFIPVLNCTSEDFT